MCCNSFGFGAYASIGIGEDQRFGSVHYIGSALANDDVKFLIAAEVAEDNITSALCWQWCSACVIEPAFVPVYP